VLSERAPRRILSLAAHLVLKGGQVIDVVLVDLSNSGCKAKTAQVLWTGDHVSLSVPGKGAIGCTVRWSRDGFAGLEFDPEPCSEEKSQTPRANVRIAANAEIKLRRLGRNAFNVALSDLSLDGCRLEVVERPRVDEAVQVVFPGLATIDAKIRWVDGFVAGLKFEQPFHPAVFDMLVERLASMIGTS
jgi:hypothetical protein